jgi:hypothetical protein
MDTFGLVSTHSTYMEEDAGMSDMFSACMN